MSYPGGKGNSYRHIINLMPPHRVYIETHLGGGSVFLHKRAADINLLIDADYSVCNRFFSTHSPSFPPKTHLFATDAVHFLTSRTIPCDSLIYSDPPYLLSTRKSGRIYKHEYDRSAHVELIDVLRNLNCMVMISGYPNDLYNDTLSSWNTHLFESVTRAGSVATECIWYNFSTPGRLHDYSYFGSTFREREILKRQQQRWRRRLRKMDPLRRHSLLLSIGTEFIDEIQFLIENNLKNSRS